jgi:hypothetical protein
MFNSLERLVILDAVPFNNPRCYDLKDIDAKEEVDNVYKQKTFHFYNFTIYKPVKKVVFEFFKKLSYTGGVKPQPSYSTGEKRGLTVPCGTSQRQLRAEAVVDRSVHCVWRLEFGTDTVFSLILWERENPYFAYSQNCEAALQGRG